MSVDVSSLQHCMDLKGEHIAAAAHASEVMAALLRRYELIAAPGKGAPILLAAIARMGTTACRWLEGELRVELSAHEGKTKIAILTTIGGGFREKVFPDTILNVPLDEFARSIALSPKLIEPLEKAKEVGTRIVLTASAEVRKTSMPPPMIEVDPSCLFTVPHDHELSLASLGGPGAGPDPSLRRNTAPFAPYTIETPELFELDAPSGATGGRKATMLGLADHAPLRPPPLAAPPAPAAAPPRPAGPPRPDPAKKIVLKKREKKT